MDVMQSFIPATTTEPTTPDTPTHLECPPTPVPPISPITDESQTTRDLDTLAQIGHSALLNRPPRLFSLITPITDESQTTPGLDTFARLGHSEEPTTVEDVIVANKLDTQTETIVLPTVIIPNPTTISYEPPPPIAAPVSIGSTLDHIDEGETSDHTIQIQNRRPLMPRSIPKDIPRRKPGIRRLRRSSSDTGIESKLRYKQGNDELNRLPHQFRNHGISPADIPPHKSWKLRRVSTAPGLRDNGTFRDNIHKEPRFLWIPSTLSNADTLCHTGHAMPKEKSVSGGPNEPLRTCLKLKSKSAASSPPNTARKPCLKQKAKSATSSPPPGPRSMGGQSTPKTKAVDFKTPAPRRFASVPRLRSWLNENTGEPVEGNEGDAPRSKSPVLLAPRPKSRAADAAITRTDVHVIAVSSIQDDQDNIAAVKRSATPTKQIVESGTGTFEVVWDDAPESPLERDTRRCGSSAGQALEAAGSFGLEKVNTKLTDWRWGKVNPFEQNPQRGRKPSTFIPEIVVFPDESYQRSTNVTSNIHRFQSLTDSTLNSSTDTDAPFTAPPNSIESSTLLPRHSPRAEGSTATTSSLSTSTSSYSSKSIPSPIPSPSPATSLRPKFEKNDFLIPSASAEDFCMRPKNRNISTLEDPSFQYHRDSVALSRARLAEGRMKREMQHQNAVTAISVGGVDPERFKHRNSVAIAAGTV